MKLTRNVGTKFMVFKRCFFFFVLKKVYKNKLAKISKAETYLLILVVASLAYLKKDYRTVGLYV